MSEPYQPDAAEQGGGPRVPADPPWGVAAGLVIIVAYMVTTWLLWRVLAAQPGLRGEITALIASGLLILLVTGTFLRVRGGAGSQARRLIGLVLPDRAGLRRAVKPVLFGALVFAGVAVGWGLVLQRLYNGPIPEQPIIKLLRATTSVPAIVLAFLGGALVAPAVEEVLFRGMLYLPMRKALGVRWAAVLVSLLFAVIHFYGWGLPQLFVLSLIFVALFERTGTLLAPIAAHVAYNAVQIALVLLGWT